MPQRCGGGGGGGIHQPCRLCWWRCAMGPPAMLHPGAASVTPAHATAAKAATNFILFIVWFLSLFRASLFSRLHIVRIRSPKFLTGFFRQPTSPLS